MPLIYGLKAIWSCLLWLSYFGTVRFSTIWKSGNPDGYGLVFLILIFGTMLYFTFRGSYYFS